MKIFTKNVQLLELFVMFTGTIHNKQDNISGLIIEKDFLINQLFNQSSVSRMARPPVKILI